MKSQSSNLGLGLALGDASQLHFLLELLQLLVCFLALNNQSLHSMKAIFSLGNRCIEGSLSHFVVFFRALVLDSLLNGLHTECRYNAEGSKPSVLPVLA